MPPPNGRKQDRRPVKAITVRLNYATGPSVEKCGGKKFCRVIVGSQQHETPKRRPSKTESNKVEVTWNCILVFPYTTEETLEIQLHDAEGKTNFRPSAKIDLNELKELSDESSTAEFELDDGTMINAHIAFYPRPVSRVDNDNLEGIPAVMLSPSEKKNNDSEVHDDEKIESLINQTVSFWGADDPFDTKKKRNPVMITIGNPDGAVYDRIKVNPKNELFPLRQAHNLGIESIYVQLAGGTVAFIDEESSEEAESFWSQEDMKPRQNQSLISSELSETSNGQSPQEKPQADFPLCAQLHSMHTQQQPVHMHQQPMYTQQGSLHMQQQPMHVHQQSMYTQQQMQAQQQPMYTPQQPMYAQQQPMHMHQQPMYTQQGSLHMQQPMYTHQGSLHMQQQPMYTQQGSLHMQQQQMHAQQQSMHMSQPPMYTQQGSLHMQQHSMHAQHSMQAQQHPTYAQQQQMYMQQHPTYTPQQPTYTPQQAMYTQQHPMYQSQHQM